MADKPQAKIKKAQRKPVGKVVIKPGEQDAFVSVDLEDAKRRLMSVDLTPEMRAFVGTREAK